MTIENQDQGAQDAAPLLKQTVLDGESFQVCRAELAEFLAEARNRLQSLSQALTRIERVQPSHVKSDPMTSQSEPVSAAPIDDDSTCGTVQRPEQQVAWPDLLVIDSPVCDDGDEDPMQRLNAIKRRLADQMHSAS